MPVSSVFFVDLFCLCKDDALLTFQLMPLMFNGDIFCFYKKIICSASSYILLVVYKYVL